MFSRINNASKAKKPAVIIPYSKVKMEIAKLLEKRGLAGEISKRGKKNRRSIEFKLFYDENGSSRIEEIKRISKPSRRIYKGWRELRPLKRGLGFYIISTPAGVIDDKQAKHLKVGGEVMGEAW